MTEESKEPAKPKIVATAQIFLLSNGDVVLDGRKNKELSGKKLVEAFATALAMVSISMPKKEVVKILSKKRDECERFATERRAWDIPEA